MNKLLWIICGCLLLAACGRSLSSEEVTLQLNPAVGATYNMVMNMDMDMSSSMLNTETEMQIFFSISVDDKRNDTLFMTARYDRVILEQIFPPLGKITYDSEDRGDEINDMTIAMDKVFSRMIDKPIRVIMNTSGEMLEIADVTDSLSLEGAALQETATSGMDMNELIGNMLANFPDHKIKEGDTWERTADRSGNLPATIYTKYEVSRVYSDEVVIEISGTLDLNREGDQKMEVNNLSGEFKGKITVDRETGWTTDASLDQDINMALKNMGVVVDMKMKNNINFETK